MTASTRLYYLANIRMPTEKAHGLQIVQNCEAFAGAGAQVTLLVTTRVNTPEMRQIADIYAHYGVARSFTLGRVPCLDLFPLGKWFERVAFPLQTLTYTLMLTLLLLFRQAEVYYSRDVLTLLALSLFKPRRTLVYEAHQLAKSRIGAQLQTWCVRRVGQVVAVTGKLAAELQARGASRVMVEHDGFRVERFADLPDRAAARAALHLPSEAFIVGYVGQLLTMLMGKGIDVLIEAIAHAPDLPLYLCLVGGPEDAAAQLRERWLGLGLPAERWLSVGRTPPATVPRYIRAFDVCTMTFPFTEHFAYYASPLKLFEYMAAGGAILASDLPAVAEVVTDGETALLTPPSGVPAMAAALRRLYDDEALRERLGANARRAAAHYSWARRAERILGQISIPSLDAR
jgi:glycosyltransferase involved in cell wall biosynthesis